MIKNIKKLTVLIAIMAISMTSHAGIKFSNTAPSGQTLWFEIENLYSTYATLVYPNESYAGGYWTGSAKPVGDIIVPSTVSYSGYTYPVTAVGARTFNYCDSITSIVLPPSVTYIGQYAFSQCYGLQSIDLGGSIETIQSATFIKCTTLVDITGLESVRHICSAAFKECSSLQFINLPPQVDSIEVSAFNQCSSLAVMVLPDSVTAIAVSTFQYCSSLTTVVLHDRITSIGNYAFQNCTSLRDVDLGNGLASIGSHAFNGCTSLSSIILPASLTAIGSTAFGYTPVLDTVVIRATTPPNIMTTSFYGKYTTTHLFPPCQSITAYQSASVWSQFTHIECGLVAEVHPSNPLLGQTTGGGVYDTVTDITLTALPTFGSLFYGWSNGVHDNPYTLHLTNDTIVTAMFYAMDSNLVTVIQDTLTQYLHDTTIVMEYIHDTTTVIEYIHDTTMVTEYIEVHDTVWQTSTDTAWLTEYIHDTIYIHDTMYVGINGVDALDAKIYSNGGQIVVEGAEQNTVTLFDISGRILDTKQDYGAPLRFDVPATGTYLVKIGCHAALKIVVIKQ